MFSMRRLKTKRASRKMGLSERIIAEAKRKTAQARRMLGAAQSSSAVSNATAVQTSRVSRGIAKVTGPQYNFTRTEHFNHISG